MIGNVPRPRPQLQLAADLEARLERQHQVEHDQVRQLQLRLPQALLAVVGDENLESLALQVAGQHLDQRPLVFDHQDLRFRHGNTSSFDEASGLCVSRPLF